MDINVDVNKLYVGLRSVKKIYEELIIVSDKLTELSNIVVGELSSASMLSQINNDINTISNEKLIMIISNMARVINIFEKNGVEIDESFVNEEVTDIIGNVDGEIVKNIDMSDVPLINQYDYKGVKYSLNDVAGNGCGLTSVCMISSYLTGELHTPDQYASLVDDGQSNVERMTKAADLMGLKWTRNPNTNINVLKESLSDGNLVICLVNASSHFVVCKGITADGKILVNDPAGGVEKALTAKELNMSAGSTWIFNLEENGVKHDPIVEL